MSKTVKIILIIVVIAALAFGLFVGASFFGNPLGKAIAKRAATDYVAAEYGDTDYVIEDVSYDVKMGDYAALVTSPSSPDTVFHLHFSGWGKLNGNDYPYEVGNNFTTYRRVNGDYRDLVDQMLAAEYPPEHFFIAFGDLGFDMSREMEQFGIEDFTLPMSELVRDKTYDVRELGEQAGMLTIYAASEDITYAEAARVLLELKDNLDKHDIPFRTIDFVLEKPRKDGVVSDEESINILYFPAAELDAEGLEERLEKAHQKTLDFYAVMDGEKQAEYERYREDAAGP